MDAIIQFFNLKGILLVAVIFVPLEHLRPLRPDQKILRRAWKIDLAYLLLNGIPLKIALLLTMAGMIVAFDWPAIDTLRAQVARQPYWLQAIELVLLADLGFYWAHRAFHHFPVLWKFHAIHHSIEDLDWLAGHRVHFLDQTTVKAASMLPVILLGFSEWALAVHVVTYRWQSVLLHSNISLGFGPLNWLIASPKFHHWHHANQPEAYDKNFSGQLSLWDYVFGTAYLPRGQQPTRYGISDPIPSGFFGQLIYPFRSHPTATATGDTVETALPKA